MSCGLGGGGHISRIENNRALMRQLQRFGLEDYELSDGPPSGNHGVLIVRTGAAQLVVKHFPKLTLDERLRWLREVRFLTWANSNNVSRYVPRIVNQTMWGGMVIQEFITGRSVFEPSVGNYLAAAGFYKALVAAGDVSFVPKIRARESLVSSSLLQRQLLERKQVIAKVALMAQGVPDVASLLEVFTSYPDSQISADSMETVDFSDAFSKAIGAAFIVSPSDFGFHNFIQTDDQGNGKFIDFEYAGIDRPLKPFMDFLMQPEHSPQGRGSAVFVKALGLPEGFTATIPASTIRPFALKWAGIVARKMVLNSNSSSTFGSHYVQRLNRYVQFFRGGF